MQDVHTLEIPSLDKIVALTAAQRADCVSALGGELIAEFQQICEFELDRVLIAHESVPLHPSNCANDHARAWVLNRFERHHSLLIRFAEHDFASSTWVGRNLRKRAARVLRECSGLIDLVTFLARFEQDGIPGLYAMWGESLIRMTGSLVLLLTSDDADARLELLTDYAGFGPQGVAWHEALEELFETARAAGPPSYEEVAEVLVGEPPAAPPEKPLSEQYPGGAARLVALGARQLAPLYGEGRIPAYSADGFLGDALKLGSSLFPLVAHYTAAHVGQLVLQALVVDDDATIDVLASFYERQPPRIQAAGENLNRLMESAHRNPHSLDLPDAYRTLAEGILRPFGSLLFRLHEIVSGKSLHEFVPFETLGRMDDALGTTSTPLIELARLGLDRDLRNYEAHEDIVVTADGRLVAVDDDGTHREIDPQALVEKIRLLRSFLDGVDVAMDVAFMQFVLPFQAFPAERAQHTQASLSLFAKRLAALLAEATVSNISVHADVITVVVRGASELGQTGLLARAILAQVDPAVTAVRLVDPADVLLHEERRQPDD